MNCEYVNLIRNLLMTVTLSVLPSLIILRFFYKKDKSPEPRTYPLATIVYKIQNPMMAAMYWSLFCAALPEEFFKFLVLTKYSLKHPAFDEPLDGIIYGVTASLGFATIESMMYISRFGIAAAIPRALTSVPSHACFGIIMGFYVSEACGLRVKSIFFRSVCGSFYFGNIMVAKVNEVYA